MGRGKHYARIESVEVNEGKSTRVRTTIRPARVSSTGSVGTGSVGMATYRAKRPVRVFLWDADQTMEVKLQAGDTVTGRPMVSFAAPGRIRLTLGRKAHVVLHAADWTQEERGE